MFRKKPKADDILSACLLDFFSKGLGPEYEGVFHGKPYSLTRNLLENLYFTGFINGLMLIVLRYVLPSKGIMTISVTMSIWERVLEEFFGRAAAIRMKQIHHAHATDSNGPYKEGTLDAATYFGLDYDLLNSNFSDKNLDEAKKELKKDDKLKKFLELTLWKRVASGEALSVTEVALGDDNNANSFEKNKEKKNIKEKAEKNQRSDFFIKEEKSGFKKSTNRSFSAGINEKGGPEQAFLRGLECEEEGDDEEKRGVYSGEMGGRESKNKNTNIKLSIMGEKKWLHPVFLQLVFGFLILFLILLSRVPAWNSLTPTSAPPITPPKASVQDQYSYARQFLLKRDFVSAEQALAAFVRNHPKDSLAGSAQYWLGETFYVRSDFQTAARTFAEGLQRYPDSDKAPDSLLKLGMSLAQLDLKDDACITLWKLRVEYPEAPTSIVQRADREIGRLQCSKTAPKVPERANTPETVANKAEKAPQQSKMVGVASTMELNRLGNMIRRQVTPCWSPPPGGRDADTLQVSLQIFVDPQGNVSQVTVINETRIAVDRYFRAAAEAARRAVLKCAPFDLPADKYDIWKQIKVNFDLSD